MGRILVASSAGVARITISSPARRNAISFSMWEALARALSDCAEDPAVRVVVLRGDGRAAFAAGSDISEFDARRAADSDTREYQRVVEKALRALEEVPCPAIACIHGVCVGGGLELALGCDIRVAARTAWLRMPAARLGLGYEFGSIDRLVKIVGPAFAADLCFTARVFDGTEAMRLGLVHEACDADALDQRVDAIVEQIAANAPLTVRAAKLAIRAALGGRLAPSVPQVEQAVAACYASADYAEGRRAFLEKRAPVFNGS